MKRLLEVLPEAKVVATAPFGYSASPVLTLPLDHSQRQSPAGVFTTDLYSSG